LSREAAFLGEKERKTEPSEGIWYLDNAAPK
jgi:hypothetical protein